MSGRKKAVVTGDDPLTRLFAARGWGAPAEPSASGGSVVAGAAAAQQHARRTASAAAAAPPSRSRRTEPKRAPARTSGAEEARTAPAGFASPLSALAGRLAGGAPGTPDSHDGSPSSSPAGALDDAALFSGLPSLPAESTGAPHVVPDAVSDAAKAERGLLFASPPPVPHAKGADASAETAANDAGAQSSGASESSAKSAPGPGVAADAAHVGETGARSRSASMLPNLSAAPVLAGEKELTRQEDAYFRGPLGDRVNGCFVVTTYSVRFEPKGYLPHALRHLPKAFFTVPHTAVRRIETVVVKAPKRAKRDVAPPELKATKSGGVSGDSGMPGSPGSPSSSFSDKDGTVLVLACKDFRTLRFGFSEEVPPEYMASVARFLGELSAPLNYRELFAFTHTQPFPSVRVRGGADGDPGWSVYDLSREMHRIGALTARAREVLPRGSTVEKGSGGAPLWQYCDLNLEYSFSPTYPERFMVPAAATSEEITESDEALLQYVRRAAAEDTSRYAEGAGDGSKPGHGALPRLLIADCRPRANALANRATGMGYEIGYDGCDVEFLGIHNIHAVRESHRRLETLCCGTGSGDEHKWLQAVEDTGWLAHLRTVLSGGIRCARALHGGCPVLVHCSDGWDRTSQVCALAEMMLDPFYRTIEGFAVLICKDWLSFGHRFETRVGHLRSSKDSQDHMSPVFLQFLDSVWQLVVQHPRAFEFSPRMLLAVAHHLYSCRFGDFLFDCEADREERRLSATTPSLWSYLLARTDVFGNPFYDPTLGVVLPETSSTLRQVRLWSDYYLRWSPRPSFPASGAILSRVPAHSFSDDSPCQSWIATIKAGNGSGVDDSDLFLESSRGIGLSELARSGYSTALDELEVVMCRALRGEAQAEALAASVQQTDTPEASGGAGGETSSSAALGSETARKSLAALLAGDAAPVRSRRASSLAPVVEGSDGDGPNREVSPEEGAVSESADDGQLLHLALDRARSSEAELAAAMSRIEQLERALALTQDNVPDSADHAVYDTAQAESRLDEDTDEPTDDEAEGRPAGNPSLGSTPPDTASAAGPPSNGLASLPAGSLVAAAGGASDEDDDTDDSLDLGHGTAL